MKKIYTLIAFVSLGAAGVSQAQNLIKSIPHVTASKNQTVINSLHTGNTQANTNSAAVLWSDDFSVPANWSITKEAGSTGDWVINNIGPVGTYKIDTINSTTRSNGFALFDSDQICSGNQQAHITTASPINLSANPAVVLQFQQQYRKYYDSTFVQVSTDGVSWTKFDINQNVATNAYPASGDNPDTVTMNISAVAGGQATVWIRFTFYSTTADMGANAGCAYSWMVDDVQIMDAPANELKLLDVYHTQYSKIPMGQQMPIQAGGYIVNEGATAQTNVMLNVKITPGTYDKNSPAMTLAVAQQEYFEVDAADAFTPGNVGTYTITLKAMQDQVDVNMGNNIKTSTFQVTDSVYSRDNNFYSGGTYYGPGISYELGNIFDIKNAAQVSSISFVLSDGTESDGLDVKAKLYEVTDTTVVPWVFTLVGESDLHTVVPADKPTATGANPVAVRLRLNGGPIPVNANTMYLASVENSGATVGPPATYVAMADGSDYLQELGTSWASVSGGTWGVTDATPMIRLNMAYGVGIEEAANEINVAVLPNPSNGLVNITCNGFDGLTTIKITNTNGQLVQSLTENLTKGAVKQFNLSELAKGLYFVQVTNDSNTLTKKIVLE